MKKILCLFFTLILFIGSAVASDDIDAFVKQIQKNAAGFKLKQNEYYKAALKGNEADNEEAFKKLYANYIDYFNDIYVYHSEHVSTPYNKKYYTEHKDEYKSYGLGFVVSGIYWDLTQDYTMLLNTPGIPQAWFEWLTLQEKYTLKNSEVCLKMYDKNSIGCSEGGTMTIKEQEQAIVDLSKIEQKSKAVASVKTKDFDYIPYTSNDIIYEYLLGNDLDPVFDENENGFQKLNKYSKKSFEHFLKHNKDNKYYEVVNDYYNKLKQNNFMYSSRINAWLIDELFNIQ